MIVFAFREKNTTSPCPPMYVSMCGIVVPCSVIMCPPIYRTRFTFSPPPPLSTDDAAPWENLPGPPSKVWISTQGFAKKSKKYYKLKFDSFEANFFNWHVPKFSMFVENFFFIVSFVAGGVTTKPCHSRFYSLPPLPPPLVSHIHVHACVQEQPCLVIKVSPWGRRGVQSGPTSKRRSFTHKYTNSK